MYVKGRGSFVRLGAYFSDLPVEMNYWRNPVSMVRCEDCHACLNACPTHAIDSDRFLLHAASPSGMKNQPAWNSRVG